MFLPRYASTDPAPGVMDGDDGTPSLEPPDEARAEKKRGTRLSSPSPRVEGSRGRMGEDMDAVLRLRLLMLLLMRVPPARSEKGVPVRVRNETGAPPLSARGLLAVVVLGASECTARGIVASPTLEEPSGVACGEPGMKKLSESKQSRERGGDEEGRRST